MGNQKQFANFNISTSFVGNSCLRFPLLLVMRALSPCATSTRFSRARWPLRKWLDYVGFPTKPEQKTPHESADCVIWGQHAWQKNESRRMHNSRLSKREGANAHQIPPQFFLAGNKAVLRLCCLFLVGSTKPPPNA